MQQQPKDCGIEREPGTETSALESGAFYNHFFLLRLLLSFTFCVFFFLSSLLFFWPAKQRTWYESKQQSVQSSKTFRCCFVCCECDVFFFVFEFFFFSRFSSPETQLLVTDVTVTF